ncbi:MAG: SRPBCC family protein [Candidatus Nanopelagicales bacterium]
MTALANICVDVIVDCPQRQVWDAVTDWPSQSEWVLATTIRNTANQGIGVGGSFEAFTGVGRVGVLDPMRITEWDPPRRVVVKHMGSVVRGWGIFEVFALPGDRSRFVWSEQLNLPLGHAGRLLWPLVRPVVAAGVRHSLSDFRKQLEAKRPIVPAS